MSNLDDSPIRDEPLDDTPVIAVLDYSSKQAESIAETLASAGADVYVTSNWAMCIAADGLIVPGADSGIDISSALLSVRAAEMIDARLLANKSVLVLLGSLVAGMLSSASGIKALTPFVSDMFPGVLCFFLLDLGLVAARRISDLKGSRAFCLGFGILFPLLTGTVAVGISKAVGLTEGNAVLFTILCASASYIAVPAALRAALPAANPGLYVGLALGVTFPFNLLVGIPLAYTCIHYFWL